MTGEGESQFFADMKHMASPPTPSNSKHHPIPNTQWANHYQLMSHIKSVELVPMT